METDWILDEIATGLQKLFLLCLDRAPPADLLAGTAHAWLEAVTSHNAFEPVRDVPRMRTAFRTLASECTSWPSPKRFLEALPRVEQRALGYEVKPATREEAERAMARIRALLDEPLPDHRIPEPAARQGQPLSEVEAGLQVHYRDRRSAAAGDPS